jgi:hypothetical protein
MKMTGEQLYLWTRAIKQYVLMTENWSTEKIKFDRGKYSDYIYVPYEQWTKNMLIFMTIIIPKDFLIGSMEETMYIEIPREDPDDKI